jgi:hypothetical protein
VRFASLEGIACLGRVSVRHVIDVLFANDISFRVCIEVFNNMLCRDWWQTATAPASKIPSVSNGWRRQVLLSQPRVHYSFNFEYCKAFQFLQNLVFYQNHRTNVFNLVRCLDSTWKIRLL